jgi:uridine kinase
MDREELPSFLVGVIVGRKIEGRPLKVAIDGRRGAGKTVLADELAALIRARGFQVLRPSVDGFHQPRERRYRQGEYSAQGYYEDAFNCEAVVEGLLAPLSGDVFPVNCREVSPDLRANLPSDAPPVRAGAESILLFDGIFLFRRELNPWWDFRILVDVDSQTALSRALVRDVEAIGPVDAIRRKYEVRYEPAWGIYCDAEQPESKADVVVDNRDFARPGILRPLSQPTGASAAGRGSRPTVNSETGYSRG